MKILILFCAITFWALNALSKEIDCAEAYGGKSNRCIRIACDEKYQSFLGKWSGPFSTYVQELSKEKKEVFRPFYNVVSYSEADCLKNISNGDAFIIGRRTDNYPAFKNLSAKIEHGLLITGKRSNGSPFLRTVDENGLLEYQLVYQNKLANLSVWSLSLPAKPNSPEMRFTVIDGQDFSETKAHKRNVTVTLSVGPVATPFWEGVVSSGFHSLSK